MKVCILSMQRVPNFGSLLQSYALKSMLEKNGHTVEFIDIVPNGNDNGLLAGKQNVFLKEGECGGTFLSKLKKIDRYTLNRLRIKYQNRRQMELLEKFRIAELDIRQESNAKKYDCCVIGSDEVFNCLSGADWGFTSQLFGNVEQAAHVITYAASCGATVYENVPVAARQKIQEAFDQVEAFSVRDNNTYEFTSRLTDRKIEQHLDPVLVYDFSTEVSRTPVPDNLPKKYCIVYSYYNRFAETEDINRICAFCKRKNLELVTVGSPQKWIKNHLVLHPFEVFHVFQKAEFVITDTFHGTIFSAKYAKRFAVLVRESNRNKLMDLVTKLDLNDHLISTTEDLEQVYAREADYNGINKIIEIERSKAVSYLGESI